MSVAPPKEDENVRIPDAVKRAAERANAHFTKEDEDDPKKDYSKETPAPAPDSGADSVAAADAEHDEGASDGDIEADDGDSAGRDAGGEGDAEEVTSEGNWEHKYKSMKGRHDKSEERLVAATNRIGNMEQTLASMEEVPADIKVDSVNTDRLITDTEETDYGSEFLDVVGKKALDSINPELAKLQDQFNTLSAQMSTVDTNVSSAARTTMETTLNKDVPDWKKINHDPQFMAWLQLPDPYSGAIRHELLKAAHQANDSPRVTAFFNGFLAEEAAVAPVISEPDPVPGEQPADGKVPLENFAAPGRAKTPAAQQNAPEEKPVISRAQITQFYTDVAAGKYKGRDKAKDKLEGQIFSAKRDGRIR